MPSKDSKSPVQKAVEPILMPSKRKSFLFPTTPSLPSFFSSLNPSTLTWYDVHRDIRAGHQMQEKEVASDSFFYFSNRK